MTLPTPRQFGLDYDTWRPGQYEAIRWVANVGLESRGYPKPQIAEMPTGSGKSPIAMSLSRADALGFPSRHDQVVVLTKSRNLQNQYGSLFKDCHVHFGRSNYDCINHENLMSIPGANADECAYQGNMRKCPDYYDCPYVVSKEEAIISERTTLNYAYWLVASRQFDGLSWLVLDEAHNLSDIVLDHAGVIIGEHVRERWDLPEFPLLKDKSWALFEAEGSDNTYEIVTEWLSSCTKVLSGRIAVLKSEIDRRKGSRSKMLMADVLSCERVRERVRAAWIALTAKPGDHWFIRCGKNLSFWHGRPEPALICRPMTARHDFYRMFPEQKQTLMMSATIGKPDVFAAELGIKEWGWHISESSWKPESRAVHVLDAPAMGRAAIRKDPKAVDKQADAIANAIKAQDPSWSGLVLVTRKSEAIALGERLSQRGLQDRIYVMAGADGTYTPTEQQVQQWDAERKLYPNSICITWSLWEGYDGLDEKICIVAKTPFPYLGDEYEAERMKFDGKMFLQRTAYTLEQGLGRTRRGREEDYDTNGQKNGYVAIADMNYRRVQSYLSQSLRDAIVDDSKGSSK